MCHLQQGHGGPFRQLLRTEAVDGWGMIRRMRDEKGIVDLRQNCIDLGCPNYIKAAIKLLLS